MKLIGKIIAVLLLRLNVPRDEVAQFTDQIERRKESGTVPEELKSRIMKERDSDKLGKWLKAAARTQSIEDFISKMDS